MLCFVLINSVILNRLCVWILTIGGFVSGERCLDPQTRMLQLYQINPTADWVVRVNVDR